MVEPVYFLKLELENVACFGQHAMLDLSDGKGNWRNWTVILGDNGTGKSTLLKILALSDIREQGTKFEYMPQTLLDFSSMEPYGVATPIFANQTIEYAASLIPKMYFNQYEFSHSQNFSYEKLRQLEVFGYGANRMMSSIYQSPMGVIKDLGIETLFNDDGNLINAEEWLLQLDYAASKDSQVKEFALNKRNQVEQMLIDLLPDIKDIRFTDPTKESLKSKVEFKSDFGWVNLHNLSLGYKTMVSWMIDLAARLFQRYPDSENPLAEPAIVLVDEIDLHLHPKWQRKIFDYLSSKFPNTQFIVTAHSPLVVQSAPKDANLILLRKNGDHVVIDNDIKSVHNWRLDQVLSSDLFGIESARGPEVEKWLAERKTLLQKENLTQQEKETLAELNKKARSLPTAADSDDIEAMEIIREAAGYLKNYNAK